MGTWEPSLQTLINKAFASSQYHENLVRTIGNFSKQEEGNIMQEQFNSLLVRIKEIALEKEIYDIVKLIEDISDLLGDDYEIYKLGD